MQPRQAIHVLLVEDNPDDILITRRAITRAHIMGKLSIARDGQEALDVLFDGAEAGGEGPRPNLVLLDLNLPKIAGLEVLRRVRESALLAALPIIVLSASSREEDIMASYRGGANTYVQKPVEFEAFMRLIDVATEYWLEVATLPPDGRGRV